MFSTALWSVDNAFQEFRPLPVPEGQGENSPAFQRRDNSRFAQVPKGWLNRCMSYVSSYYHCVFSTKERRRV